MSDSSSAEARAGYPVVLNPRWLRCVIVGAGSVGERKARGLVDAGARPVVVAREATAKVQELARSELAELVLAGYAPEMLAGADLVFAATGDAQLNRRIHADAKAAGALVNVVDDPTRSDFFSLSHSRTGDVILAVGTGGRSPAFARALRKHLEETVLPQLAMHLQQFEGWRDEVERCIPDSAARAAVWQELEQGHLFRVLLDEGPEAAQMLVWETLEAWNTGESQPGRPRPD